MDITDPIEAPVRPVAPPLAIDPTAPMLIDPDSVIYPYDTPSHAYHNVRVLCDKANLTVNEKNLICACIFQESRFNNDAKNLNKNNTGTVTSTDWGICQINDYYHIAPHGSPFSSVAYVLENPGAVAAWMISMYQKGELKQWVSYSSGAYKKWLAASSPMWELATPMS